MRSMQNNKTNTAPHRDTRHENPLNFYHFLLTTSLTRALFFLAFAQGLLSALIAGVLPLWLRHQYGIAISDLFLVISISVIGTALLNLAAGHLADRRLGKKRYYLLALSLSALRYLAFAFHPQLVFVIALNWFTQLSASAVLFAFVADQCADYDAERRAQINASIRLAVSLGTIPGLSLGLFLYEGLSPLQYFFVLAGLHLALLLYLQLRFRERQAHLHQSTVLDDSYPATTNGPKRCSKSLLDTDRIRNRIRAWNLPLLSFVLVTTTLLFLGIQSIQTLLTLIVEERYGAKALAPLLSFSSSVDLIAFLAYPLALRWLHGQRLLRWTILLGVFYFALFPFAGELWIFYPLQFIGQIQAGFLFLSMMAWVQAQEPKRTAFMTSYFFTCLIIAATLSGLLISFVSRYSLHAVFFCFAGAMLLGLLLYSYLAKQKTPAQ